jgi:hypothetical protein
MPSSSSDVCKNLVNESNRTFCTHWTASETTVRHSRPKNQSKVDAFVNKSEGVKSKNQSKIDRNRKEGSVFSQNLCSSLAIFARLYSSSYISVAGGYVHLHDSTWQELVHPDSQHSVLLLHDDHRCFIYGVLTALLSSLWQKLLNLKLFETLIITIYRHRSNVFQKPQMQFDVFWHAH